MHHFTAAAVINLRIHEYLSCGGSAADEGLINYDKHDSLIIIHVFFCSSKPKLTDQAEQVLSFNDTDVQEFKELETVCVLFVSKPNIDL